MKRNTFFKWQSLFVVFALIAALTLAVLPDSKWTLTDGDGMAFLDDPNSRWTLTDGDGMAFLDDPNSRWVLTDGSEDPNSRWTLDV